MNTRQKVNQMKAQLWAQRIHDQKESGLTIAAWCDANNLSIHTYQYWKKKFRHQYVDEILPDIVPITPVAVPTETVNTVTTVATVTPAQTVNTVTTIPTVTPDSAVNKVTSVPTAAPTQIVDTVTTINIGDISISFGQSVSDEKLLSLIKAVRHA